jgi:hypothetical protein
MGFLKVLKVFRFYLVHFFKATGSFVMGDVEFESAKGTLKHGRRLA